MLLNEGHRLHQAQYQDPVIRQVLSWVRKGEFPPKASIPRRENSLRRFYSERDRLVLHDGLLCRLKPSTSASLVRQVVIPDQLIPNVLGILHGSPLSGHFSADKTIQKADGVCYWQSMRRDITDFCSRCPSCQARRNPVPALRAPLQPIPSTRPFERIAADLTELPTTSRGNRYVLVVMDYFTKYVNLFPLPDQKATTVAKCLFDGYIRQHGIPESIHTDQGRQFEAQLIQSLCQELGIAKTRTSPYHPQSDGMVERFNRTLKRELGKRLAQAAGEWDQVLGQVELAYNTTPHSSTGFTPFFLVHGREARLPLSLLTATNPNLPSVSTDDYAAELLTRLNFALRQTSVHADHARDAQKRQYDIGSRFMPYDIDDMVWITDPTASRDKLAAQWKGPYRVTKRDEHGIIYHLVDPSAPSSSPKVLHYNRLKPYLDPPQSNPSRDATSHLPPPAGPQTPPVIPPPLSTNIWLSPSHQPPTPIVPATPSSNEHAPVPPATPSHDAHARNHDPRIQTRSGRIVHPPDYYGSPIPSQLT